MTERGPVRVVDEDGELEGDVELDPDGWDGDTWRNAGDGCGDDGRGRVFDFKNGEVEDESYGEEDQ